MNTIQKTTRVTLFVFLLLMASLVSTEIVSAVGISVDAGLTPAEHRLIFRTQTRFMQRDNDPTPMQREMKMYIWPVVVAYGVRSDLTLMARQIVRKNEMTMAGNTTTETGLTDLLLLAKYRLARVNRAAYSFGIAPTLGIELPTGQDGFSSNSYDLRFGLFFSGRKRAWGLDLSSSYIWNGMATTSEATKELGNEFSIESAIAYQMSLGSRADYALAPLVEFTYQTSSADSNDGVDIANTGESILILSPGFKLTKGSFIFESLVQLPVWQDQNGLQPERGTGFIVGIRLMN